jgi:hypothetical protein
VLYADSAALDADAINLEAMETLVRVAGMAVELLVGGSRSAAAVQAQPSAAAPAITEEPQAEEGTSEQTQPAAEASAPTPPQTGETGESPRPWSEAEAAVKEETPGADAASEASSASMPADDIGEETLVMEAPQVRAEVYPPSSTAEPQATAEAPDQQQAAAPAAGRRWGRGDTELPVEVSDDDERRQHNDARRFARLLVSEIKLYNEQKVRDGRLEGDLYERLREDIDRSRQMYDKRVAPPVAARYDYFYHELVNTLAEGDPSKLGSDYPGQAA